MVSTSDRGPLETVYAYHQRTMHYPGRFAPSLGYLDWATQPDPFRRYAGARLVSLDEIAPTSEPSYDSIYSTPRVSRPLDRGSLSQLFYDSLALSAWKAAGATRWSLRVNPSSGNLHPTEGYLIAGPVAQISEQPLVCHYAPRLHALEVRAELRAEEWRSLTSGLPSESVLVGLTSIHWRESWKYGERAFRYCQHDVGHAIAAVALAAAVLGWRAWLVDAVSDDQLARLLGIEGQRGIEAEHPDCLIVIETRPSHDAAASRWRPPAAGCVGLEPSRLCGVPNALSRDHHEWAAIDEVAAACRRSSADEPARLERWAIRGEPEKHSDATSHVSARQIIRQRRSAVEMDGRTRLARSSFYAMLERLRPGRPPFTAAGWRPAIHLALFVHRVDDLDPGLYLLVREPGEREGLRAELRPSFDWEPAPARPEGLDLVLLEQGDFQEVACSISCQQPIAADGVFALGMLAEFEPRLELVGPWFYPRLYWEAGLVGQVLYLEAEAAGLRGTGIGCFFDEAMHETLGLGSRRYRSLYHFTVGGARLDPRIQTLPPYEERAARPSRIL